jgi:hypothetical protein
MVKAGREKRREDAGLEHHLRLRPRRDPAQAPERRPRPLHHQIVFGTDGWTVHLRPELVVEIAFSDVLRIFNGGRR